MNCSTKAGVAVADLTQKLIRIVLLVLAGGDKMGVRTRRPSMMSRCDPAKRGEKEGENGLVFERFNGFVWPKSTIIWSSASDG